MDDFTLKIELGNEAMRTAEDVAGALRRAAHELEVIGFQSGRILDELGNRVGYYSACHESSPQYPR